MTERPPTTVPGWNMQLGAAEIAPQLDMLPGQSPDRFVGGATFAGICGQFMFEAPQGDGDVG